MALNTTPKHIDRGVPLVDIVAATATGEAASQIFAAAPAIAGNPQAALNYVQTIPSGALTVCTVQHQISLDGGATWVNKGAPIDVVANPTGTIPAIEGVLNKLTVATLTLGTAPSVSVTLTT